MKFGILQKKLLDSKKKAYFNKIMEAPTHTSRRGVGKVDGLVWVNP